MPVNFLAVFIEKNLCGDCPDTEPIDGFPMLPDVDKSDDRFPFVHFFHLFHDRRHHFARDALFGPKIDHGNHPFDRQIFKFICPDIS